MAPNSKTQLADPSIVPVEGPANPPAGTAAVGASAAADRARTNATPPSAAGALLAAHPSAQAGLTAQPPYGPNNENLPDRLQEALRRLVLQFSTESDHARRQEIRRIKQAHQFWRGLQYLWWSERDQNWHLPFEQKITDRSSLEDLPRYEFVTNIYQAFGLSIISVLSQDVPRVRFFPQSAQAEEDISAAKAATEVAQLVERNNRIGNLAVEEAFQLWTGGKVGAYVRYVVDGQRFGFHPEAQLVARQVKLGEDIYRCANCGAETPAAAVDASSVTGDGDPVGAALAPPASASGTSATGDPRVAPTTAPRAVMLSEATRRPKATAPKGFSGALDRRPKHLNATTGNQPDSDSVARALNPEMLPRDVTLSQAKALNATGGADDRDHAPGPWAVCSECGTEFDEGSFVPAEVVTVPAVETRLRVANGQEALTIVGGLELKTPPWANEMHEYPYLQ
jgi:hypothetical protein